MHLGLQLVQSLQCLICLQSNLKNMSSFFKCASGTPSSWQVHFPSCFSRLLSFGTITFFLPMIVVQLWQMTLVNILFLSNWPFAQANLQVHFTRHLCVSVGASSFRALAASLLYFLFPIIHKSPSLSRVASVTNKDTMVALDGGLRPIGRERDYSKQVSKTCMVSSPSISIGCTIEAFGARYLPMPLMLQLEPKQQPLKLSGNLSQGAMEFAHVHPKQCKRRA